MQSVHDFSPLDEIEDDSNQKTDDRDSTANIGHHSKSKFISSGFILQKSNIVSETIGFNHACMHALHCMNPRPIIIYMNILHLKDNHFHFCRIL